MVVLDNKTKNLIADKGLILRGKQEIVDAFYIYITTNVTDNTYLVFDLNQNSFLDPYLSNKVLNNLQLYYPDVIQVGDELEHKYKGIMRLVSIDHVGGADFSDYIGYTYNFEIAKFREIFIL